MERYQIVKLPGKGEGWAIFDAAINSTIPGSRCKSRRECLEVAAGMGIEVRKGK